MITKSIIHSSLKATTLQKILVNHGLHWSQVNQLLRQRRVKLTDLEGVTYPYCRNTTVLYQDYIELIGDMSLIPQKEVKLPAVGKAVPLL